MAVNFWALVTHWTQLLASDLNYGLCILMTTGTTRWPIVVAHSRSGGIPTTAPAIRPGPLSFS